MARQVQLITIKQYHENWYDKPQTAQVFHAWWSAEQEITEVEKIEFKPQYRVRLSDGSVRILEEFIQIFLELY